MPGQPGPWTLEGLVVRVPWSLDEPDTIGRFLGREAWVLSSNGRLFYAEPPLGATGLFGIGERAGLFVHGTSREYRFSVYDIGSASLSMIVERVPTARAPTAAEVEEGWEQATRGAVARTEVEVRGRMPVPEFISDAAGVYVDDLGSLWVRRRRSEPTRVPYDVFAPDGIWLGEVVMPTDLEIFEIGDDYVLGIDRDDLGVEYIVLFSLVRAR
jgi:hypothetical protein